LNNDGEVECDAMIMDGHTMKTGVWMYNIIGILPKFVNTIEWYMLKARSCYC
jgi:hypothetical protein